MKKKKKNKEKKEEEERNEPAKKEQGIFLSSFFLFFLSSCFLSYTLPFEQRVAHAVGNVHGLAALQLEDVLNDAQLCAGRVHAAECCPVVDHQPAANHITAPVHRARLPARENGDEEGGRGGREIRKKKEQNERTKNNRHQ